MMGRRIELSRTITCKMNDTAHIIMSSFDNDAYLYSDNKIIYYDAKKKTEYFHIFTVPFVQS